MLIFVDWLSWAIQLRKKNVSSYHNIHAILEKIQVKVRLSMTYYIVLGRAMLHIARQF